MSSPVIMIVDDEKNIRHSLTRELDPLGCAIRDFASGEEALADLRVLEPFLIISDFRMAGMNGVAFLESASALWPDAFRIMLTGFADFQTAMRAVNLGHIDRLLSKPWQSDELSSVVREGLASNLVRRLTRNLPAVLSDLLDLDAVSALDDCLAPLMRDIGLDLTGLVTLDHAWTTEDWDRAWIGRYPDIGLAGHRLQTLTTQSRLLGAAMQVARQKAERRQTLERLSTVDHLSGLLNRRGMEEALDREFARMEREGTELGLLMIDIDHFKEINDGFGHAAGDAIIKLIGGAIKRNLRPTDLPARFGGDEFCLVVPGSSAEGCLNVANRLKREIAQLATGIPGLEMPTLSIGIAAAAGAGRDRRVLLQSADQALYEAKRAGRNAIRYISPIAP